MWNIIIGLVFIIGGLTGTLALRHTQSGLALAAVGVGLVAWGIYNSWRTRPAVRDARKQPKVLPSFARNFPNDPALQELVVAFEDGHYDIVRSQAPKLADSTDDPAVADAARELRRRLEPDPMAIKLLAAAIALLILLAAWAYHAGHAVHR